MQNDDTYTPEEQQLICAMAEIWIDKMSTLERHEAVSAADDADEPGLLMTTPGSMNEAFWSKMVDLDWAAREPREPKDAEKLEGFVAFSLNDRGTKMLPKFLNVVS